MAELCYCIHELGPLVACSLCVNSEYARALKACKLKVPERIHGLNALIDTGSDSVLIDSEYVGKLNLPVHSAVRASTVDGQSERYRAKCELGILLTAENEKFLWEGDAYCSDGLREDTNVDLIIGRNVLSSLVFHYDGPKNRFSLQLHAVRESD